MNQCNRSKDTEINILEQNQKALNDSVRTSKNKVDQLEFSKNILVGDKNDLKELNRDLFEEYKKENGKVSELSKLVIEIANKKPIYITNNLPANSYGDSTYGVPFTLDTIYNKDNSRTLKGETKFRAITNAKGDIDIRPLSTILTEDKFKFNVIQGLRETKNGDVEVFVRSDYPGFELKDLNSIILDPDKHPVLKKFSDKGKPKKFGIGVYAGYGMNTNGLSPQVGVGLIYTPIRF